MFKFNKNTNIKIKIKITILAIIGLISIYSCTDDSPISNNNNWSSLKIAVFSDPHCFDPSLGTSGEAFDAYLVGDRKMVAESHEISESLINSLVAENPDIVLIPGDLTKDGELKSHQLFATMLKKLTEKGIKVYVIPGNHDILNPVSYSYSGANKSKIPNINDFDFASIYNHCGFSNTISRDPNSLSYVAEPKPGLWILAIDDCRYKENSSTFVTGGKLSVSSMNWIKARLQDAKSKNITVIGMMHHGIIEHFPGQAVLFSDYLVSDYQNVSTELAQAGLHILFTGHFHANDIVKKTIADDFIFDIETGSTVTSPCPYRIINLTNDGKMEIRTKLITQINYDLNGATDFQTYSHNNLKNGISPLVEFMLKTQLKVDEQTSIFVTPYIVSAMLAHFAGDETIDDSTKIVIKQLQSSQSTNNKILGDALFGIWNDPSPKDNNILIDLKTGIVK